jgi:HAD superfamily hydrolase (TIGR01509 family)
MSEQPVPQIAKLPRKVHAVIFDMDGLIFNTEEIYRDAVMTSAADIGHDVPPAFYLTTIGLSGDATRAAFHQRYGNDFDFEGLWTAASNRFDELAKLQLCVKAGVIELLDFLDGVRLPRAICTSSGHQSVQRHLAAMGLLDRFPTVVARGDYARGKPHPDPFLKAAERLGVAPESCVALEDSYHGVRSASGAGMMTIMVPDLFPPTADVEGLCVGIADDLHEVRRLIMSQHAG